MSKILTTHVGSLTRTQEVVDFIFAREKEPTYMLSAGVGAGGDTENTDWDALGKSNPRGRVGTPEDIAGLAIFLSSRASGFTVGDVITCDGGSVVS